MDDNITITIPESSLDTHDISSGDVTIDTSLFTSSILGSPNYTIGAVGSSVTVPYITTTNNTWGGYNKGLQVSGDADFEGDVTIKGVSIAKALEDIQKRLAILVPDPAKLEHFEALKKAYEHYKTLEALCEVPKKDD
jgi:hypothetical protein